MKLLIAIIITELLIYGRQQLPSQKPQPTPESKVESVHSVRPTPSPTPSPEENTALASWYDRSACSTRIYGKNCKTANGEIFDETKFTSACSSEFRLGDHVNLCRLGNCIEVVCTDRGNFASLGRKFDLTPSAFSSLAGLDSGVIKIKWELKR